MNVRVADVGTQGRWSRVGLLSLLSIMILVLSVGQTFAADESPEFKLWHKKPNGEIGEALKPYPKDDTDIAKAAQREDEKKLRGQVEKGIALYVAHYHNEPFQLIGGISKVLLNEANKDRGDAIALLKSIQAGVKNAPDEAFGSEKRIERHNAYNKLMDKLVEKLSKLSKEELKRLLADPKLLKELFEGDEAILFELDLTKEKPADKPTVTPTPTATPTQTKAAGVDDETRRKLEENARELERLRKEMEEAKRAKPSPSPEQPQPQPQPRPIGEQPTGPQGPVYTCPQPQPGGPGAGGANPLADVQKTVEKTLQGFKDTLNKALNDEANKNPLQFLNANNKKQNEDKQLADLLLPLLQDQNKNNQVVQPPQPPQSRPPAADQQQAQTNPGLNQPIQPEQPTQAPPVPPLQFAQQSSAPQRPIPSANLPSSSGRRAVVDTNGVLAEAQRLNKQPVPNPMMMGMQLPPPYALMMLEPEQQKTANLLNKATAQLQDSKDQEERLDEQLEQLKDGARSAMPSWIKTEEQRLQSEAETAKKNFEQRKQFAQQAAQDPQLRDQIQAQMMQEQNEVSNKEQELAKFRAQVDAKIEEGNKDIAVLKSNRDKLHKAVTQLSAEVDTLQTRKTDLDNKVQQQYMTMMQPPQQQQQPQTQNVNRIQQMGPRPSTRTSSVGTAMPQRGNAGVMRGSLGGALGAMQAGAGASSATSAQ